LNLKKTAIVLNGFIHDFFTGYWLASMITIILVHDLQAKYPGVSDLLLAIEQFFFWNSIVAVIVIFATGGVRTFTYIDNFYGADIEASRRKLLVIKHILLFAIFGISGYFAYGMAFH
jgi:uncharacterized membrane protein